MKTETDLAQKLLKEFFSEMNQKQIPIRIKEFAVFCAKKILRTEELLKNQIQMHNDTIHDVEKKIQDTKLASAFETKEYWLKQVWEWINT